ASRDLQLALDRCHSLPHGKREPLRAGLMYKQALILCQRWGELQDLNMAEENHKQALALEEHLSDEQKKRLELPRRLSGALLAVYKACTISKDADDERRAAAGANTNKALGELRKTIDELLD